MRCCYIFHLRSNRAVHMIFNTYNEQRIVHHSFLYDPVSVFVVDEFTLNILVSIVISRIRNRHGNFKNDGIRAAVFVAHKSSVLLSVV